MKISMELYTLAQRFGDIKAMEMAKQAGFDAIDYSYYYEKECDEVLGEGYKEYAQKLRAHLDNIGLVCNQAHAPFSFKYGMKFDTSEALYLSNQKTVVIPLQKLKQDACLLKQKIAVHQAKVYPEIYLQI